MVPLVLASCAVGGGPIVGYGDRGFYAGAEISTGGEVVLPQATFGYQTDQQLLYARVDETIDITAMQRPNQSPDSGSLVPGARVGGGFGVSMGQGEPLGVFEIGPTAGHALHSLSVGPNGNGCDVENTVGVIEIQIRYARGWSIALAPRLERGSTFCN